MSATQESKLKSVHVDQVCSYFASRGWKQLPSKRDDSVRFQGPLDDEGEPIVWLFPAREDFVDYARAVQILIDGLAVIEQRSRDDVLADLLQQPSGQASPVSAG